MRTYRSSDGTTWLVEITSPSFSNALVYFRHPDGRSSGRDRYNWYQWSGPESRNVTARLRKDEVIQHITPDEMETLFRRSMPISAPRPAPLAIAPDAR